jgi:hypothetical protein
VLPRGPQPRNTQELPTIPNNAQHTERSMPALTNLALDDHAAFDKFMTDEVQTQFPSMQSDQSALRVLAKE